MFNGIYHQFLSEFPTIVSIVGGSKPNVEAHDLKIWSMIRPKRASRQKCDSSQNDTNEVGFNSSASALAVQITGYHGDIFIESGVKDNLKTEGFGDPFLGVKDFKDFWNEWNE
jgi:hypothetical protein